MRVLYLDQVGGVSGDMFLAALVDLGVDVSALQAAVRTLGLPDVRLVVKPVTRAGLDALHLTVTWGRASEHAAASTEGDRPAHESLRPHHPPHSLGADPGIVASPDATRRHESSAAHDHEQHHAHAHAHRGYSEIVGLIRESDLSPGVKERAQRVFHRLATAEAAVHGIPLEDVHFHEVGAVDSIVDIVGVCWGLENLGVERLYSSAFVFGHGAVGMAHGRWPVPAPATLRLTEGFPVEMVPVQGETVTPTGAALVTALAVGIGGRVGLTLERTGTGAGSRDSSERPNVLRALLGTAEEPREIIEVLETTVDDLSPQRLARLAALLLGAGALDVWTTPVVMKKGRSGHLLTVLSSPELGPSLEDLVFRESTTLGIRRRREDRRVLARSFGCADTPWGSVSVKVAELPGGGRRVVPEFDDCQRLAREAGVPLEEILAAARVAPVRAPVGS